MILPKYIIEYRSLSKLITTYTKSCQNKLIQTQVVYILLIIKQELQQDDYLPPIQIYKIFLFVQQKADAFVKHLLHRQAYKIISADYSQIELRIMAHISKTLNLLNAFEQNLDIHKATAAEVFGIAIDKVTSEERRHAKAINFGLIYGMSAFGLVKQLGISRHEAQDYIDRYFARYPLVKAYMENTRATAHEKGYVETFMGRRLYLPDINSSQIMRQKAAERTAINAPLQGSAADIIKRAMISLNDWLAQTNN